MGMTRREIDILLSKYAGGNGLPFTVHKDLMTALEALRDLYTLPDYLKLESLIRRLEAMRNLRYAVEAADGLKNLALSRLTWMSDMQTEFKRVEDSNLEYKDLMRDLLYLDTSAEASKRYAEAFDLPDASVSIKYHVGGKSYDTLEEAAEAKAILLAASMGMDDPMPVIERVLIFKTTIKEKD